MIYLVCEGKPGNIDAQVLDKILRQKLGQYSTIAIKPVGTHSRLKNTAQGFEEASWDKNSRTYRDCVYSVEDRDLQPLSEVIATWNDPKGKHFIWRRHEIENYLLDPRIVTEAFVFLKQSVQSKHIQALPTTEAEILAVLTTLAHPLIENHVGRLTLFQIDTLHKQCDLHFLPPQKATSFDKTGWLTYFQQECLCLQQRYQNAISDVRFDYSAIEAMYNTCLSEVHTFFSSQQFLCEFGGHELLSQLLRYLNNTLKISISKEDLQAELLNALDRLYTPGFFGTDDDFQALAQKLT